MRASSDILSSQRRRHDQLGTGKFLQDEYLLWFEISSKLRQGCVFLVVSFTMICVVYQTQCHKLGSVELLICQTGNGRGVGGT